LFTGEELDLSALRGQWVVVNFWATWCVPCRVEMPELQAFYEDHDDIAIIGVNIGERRPVIAEWVTDFDLTFDIALDPRQVIYAQYRVPGQPTTFVIAPDGIITNIFYGPITADTLQSIIVDG